MPSFPPTAFGSIGARRWTASPRIGDYPEDRAFRAADVTPVDVVRVLRASGADVPVS